MADRSSYNTGRGRMLGVYGVHQGVHHDDTCTSDYTNVKETQINHNDASEADEVPSLNDDNMAGITEEHNYHSYSYSITSTPAREDTTPNTNYGYHQVSDIRAHIPEIDLPTSNDGVCSLLDGLQATPNMTSVRQKCVVASAYHTSASIIRSRCSSPESHADNFVTLSPRRRYTNISAAAFADDQIESILAEMQQRCKTNENITKGLEQQLEIKNRELSHNCVMLEENQQSLHRLQRQLDEQRTEKQQLTRRLMDIEQECNDVREERQSLKDELQRSCEGLKQAKESLKQRDSTISELNSKVVESQMECERNTDERRKSETLAGERLDMIESLRTQILDLEEKMEINQKLIADRTEEIASLKANLIKEERLRRQIEKEHQIATMQGQTLMEHQCAIQEQHREDVKEYKQMIRELREQLAESERLNMEQAERLNMSQQNSRDSISQLNTECKDLNGRLLTEREKFEQQLTQGQQEIQKLNSLLKAKTDSEAKLQKVIHTLETEQIERDSKYRTSKQQLITENEQLSMEVDRLKEQLNKEQEQWQKKLNQLTSKHATASKQLNSEVQQLRSTTEKQSIHLKCRIEELEDKLEERENILSSLKDTIAELTEAERRSSAAYNELLGEMEQSTDATQKLIEQKDVEVEKLNVQVNQLKDQKESAQKAATTELESTLEELRAEKAKLEVEISAQKEELESTRAKLEESQQLVGQLSGMRALLAKKESSKAILVAEQQRLEKEYSTTLMLKDSEITNLERELKNLYTENKELRTKHEREQGKNLQTQSLATMNNPSNVDSQAPHPNEGVEQVNDKALAAKRHSSNQILTMENTKLKSDLKKAEAWWQRDINELQRRYTQQQSVIAVMERKMTALELENIGLKGTSVDTFNYHNASEATASVSGYANLLDYYKQEISARDTKITNLEASLHTAKGETEAAAELLESVAAKEKATKHELESKLSQNELNAFKLKKSITEAEQAIENHDVKSTQTILSQSITNADTLLDNLKQCNQTLRNAMEFSSEKETSLLKMHQRFSHTLSQIHKDAIQASDQQRHQFSELQKYFETQVTKLEQTLHDTLQDKNAEVATLYRENTQLIAKNNTLAVEIKESKAEAERLSQEMLHIQKVRETLEANARKAEQELDKLRVKVTDLTVKLNVTETNMAVEMERRVSINKADVDSKMNQLVGMHQKELKSTVEKMRQIEDDNIRLHAELNQHQQKRLSGSQELEEEVQSLHGQLQKVQLEKANLQEKFKEGLDSLRKDSEELMTERNQQIQRLSCQISSLEVKNESLMTDTQNRKEVIANQLKQITSLKEQHAETVNHLKTQLMKYECQLGEMGKASHLDKRQLANALDKLTKAEIEIVRQQNLVKRYEEHEKEVENKHRAIMESMKHELDKKSNQHKQAVSEIKRLKVNLQSYEKEYRQLGEVVGTLRGDLQHAEAVINMYKAEIETFKRKSEAKLSKFEKSQSHKMANFDEAAKRQTKGPVVDVESSCGLGGKIAELTNELSAKSRQFDIVEKQLAEQNEKNLMLNETIRKVSCQRDDLVNTVEKMTRQAEVLQDHMKKVEQEKDSLKHSYGCTFEKLERLTSELSDSKRENFSLQKKLSDTQALIDKVKLEDRSMEMKYRIEELNAKLRYSKDANAELENKVKDLLQRYNNERSSLKEQLDNAYVANQSLEQYIRSLRTSYQRLLDDDSDGTVFHSSPKRSSGPWRDT